MLHLIKKNSKELTVQQHNQNTGFFESNTITHIRLSSYADKKKYKRSHICDLNRKRYNHILLKVQAPNHLPYVPPSENLHHF